MTFFPAPCPRAKVSKMQFSPCPGGSHATIEPPPATNVYEWCADSANSAKCARCRCEMFRVVCAPSPLSASLTCPHTRTSSSCSSPPSSLSLPLPSGPMGSIRVSWPGPMASRPAPGLPLCHLSPSLLPPLLSSSSGRRLSPANRGRAAKRSSQEPNRP